MAEARYGTRGDVVIPTVVCWRWLSPVGYRSVFGPETVYALREMVHRHYPKPHRFCCVTDRPKELPGIDTVLLWDDCAAIPSPTGRHNPSCFRRLKMFAPDAGKVFGERVVSIDLDTVIVGDVSHIFDRTEDFIVWGESDFARQWYNGSLWSLRTGSRPQVWTKFDPDKSPLIAHAKGARGSDQAWISHILGPKEATYGKRDGVYSFRKDVSANGWKLPANASLVAFHGKIDPWHYSAMNIPWVKAHYPFDVQVPA